MDFVEVSIMFLREGGNKIFLTHHLGRQEIDLVIQLDIYRHGCKFIFLFYLGFCLAFNTVLVIPRQIVGRAEETS